MVTRYVKDHERFPIPAITPQQAPGHLPGG